MSGAQLPQQIDSDAPVFVISVAAQLAGMHPQTLRTYDRMGLVVPRRLAKRGRRYSARDIARLRLVQRLSQDEGINLEGIRRILSMQDELDELRRRLEEMAARAHRGARRSARVAGLHRRRHRRGAPRRRSGPADRGACWRCPPARSSRQSAPAVGSVTADSGVVGGASARSGPTLAFVHGLHPRDGDLVSFGHELLRQGWGAGSDARHGSPSS